MEINRQIFSNAFQHLSEGNGQYQVPDIADPTPYYQAFQGEKAAFILENPFNSLDIDLLSSPQIDPIRITHEKKFLYSALAFGVSLTVYCLTQSYFKRKWEECKVISKEIAADTNPRASCTVITQKNFPFPDVLSRAGTVHYNGKSAPFSSAHLFSAPNVFPIKPLHIWVGKNYRLLYVLRASILMTLQGVAFLKPPLVSRNLSFLTFTAEAHPLENERIEDSYVCPLSGIRLSPQMDGRKPIRFENQVYDSASFIYHEIRHHKPWTISPSLHVDYTALKQQITRIFEISEESFDEIFHYNPSKSDFFQRYVDTDGCTTDYGLRKLGINRKQSTNLDQSLISLLEQEFNTFSYVEDAFKHKPALKYISPNQDNQALFSDIKETLRGIELSLNVYRGKLKLKADLTCAVFKFFKERSISPKESYEIFLNQKKTEEFRNIKINALVTQTTDESYHQALIKERMDRFFQATGTEDPTKIQITECVS